MHTYVIHTYIRTYVIHTYVIHTHIYNRDGMCLLRGTYWICNYHSGPLQEGRAGNAREPSKQYTFSFPLVTIINLVPLIVPLFILVLLQSPSI